MSFTGPAVGEQTAQRTFNLNRAEHTEKNRSKKSAVGKIIEIYGIET